MREEGAHLFGWDQGQNVLTGCDLKFAATSIEWKQVMVEEFNKIFWVLFLTKSHIFCIFHMTYFHN